MPARIVIFEDDALTLETLKMCLVSRGYEVLGYSEPQMCPAYSDPTLICPEKNTCADILITDNYMPRMTGLDFIRQQHLLGCKGIIRHKAIMSGNLSQADLEVARQLGCKIFSKPIILSDLLDWLKDATKAL